jgi:trk system potassium uptake protein TrkA
VAGPLKDIRFPKGAIVGGVLTDGIMQIPTGETHILPGQRVFVFVLDKEIKAIEKLFGAY